MSFSALYSVLYRRVDRCRTLLVVIGGCWKLPARQWSWADNGCCCGGECFDDDGAEIMSWWLQESKSCLTDDWHCISTLWSCDTGPRWRLDVGSDVLPVHPELVALLIVFLLYALCICAVAQYTVLEANGKANGIGKISHPYPSRTLGPVWMPIQMSHYIRPGSWCACVWTWVFLSTSIHISVPCLTYSSHFRAIWTLNRANDMFLEPLVSFGVAMK